MRTFHLLADTMFVAKDIDDALLKLAEHLMHIQWPQGGHKQLAINGTLSITAINNEETSETL